MQISEALAILAPYGVEAIDLHPYAPQEGTPVWMVRQCGRDYSYCAPLHRVVWALQAANDWE